MKSCTITLAWTAWLLTVLVAGEAVAQDPSPNDLGWLRNKCPGGEGALAYESAGKIYLTELSTGQTVEIGNGTHAEFSPDSSKLAWIDGSTARGRMRKGSSTIHTIATGVTESSGIHWISNTEVVLVRSGQWQRVPIGAGQPVAEPGLSGMPTDWFEMDVKRDGSLWILAGNPGADFHPEWKTSTGGSGSTDGQCSSSLAPEGRSMTALMESHRECQLKRIRSGGADGSLDWVWDYTAPKGFDNHRWSSNDDRFIACQDEKYNYMVVMEVGGTYCTRMGQQGSGEMYGDFTVGDGSGDPWPGTEPVLQLSPQSLSFSAVEGGSNPSQKTVSVSNSGGGTLNNVSASEDAGWLSVSRSGSGNSQTLTNSVDISGLSAGSYSQIVTVSCSNASNSPRTYTVNLQVAEPVPVLALSPVSLSFASVAGGSDPSPQDVAVTNQGGGTLDSVSAAEDAGWLSVSRSGSGNSQTLTNSVDISGLSAGSYSQIVTVSCSNASNSPRTYTVNLQVAEPVPVLALSPVSLSFASVAGGSDPSPQDVAVTNQGGGTLDSVSAAADAGWLSVSRSGSGNSQTLTNSVDISGLSAGSYSQIVTVSCSNASNSPRTYTVNLQVAEPVPVLALSPVSLSFASVAGGSDPSPQDVAVTNQGGGTLDSVSAAADAGWLSVSRSGSGNSQTLTNSIDIAGLANGIYNETVVVSCPNASNAPLSYTVTLVLSEELVLAGIEVVPAATTILAGESVEVSAYPQDQYGDAFAADIAWLVSGGGFMAPVSSGGAVTEHTSTFSSDGTQGTFTVTAESGGIQGSADITVESQPGLPIQINCGDNALTPTGWSDDDLFVQGGEDFVFSDTFDTTGVQDAAPEEVYQTCRHRIRGVETSYGYDFPALPNEEYLVRLHFADAFGPRSIDVWIEGALVIENMDIATEAGGSLRALAREFSVFVTDGDGLQIALTDDRAEPADFFVNGIEILEPEIVTDGGTEDGGTEDGGTEDGGTSDGGTNDGEVHPDGDTVADKPADDGAAADQDASVAEGREDEPAIQGSCSCSSPAGGPPIITLGLACIVVFRRRSTRSPKA